MKKNNIYINHQKLPLKPILKWVGGKKQIFNEINKRLPKTFNTYFEPFIGGGYLLFALQPKEAYINDLNKELINLYKIVKTNPNEFINNLLTFKNSKDDFYKIRSLDRDKSIFDKLSNVERASRILYLNKTCYNGLYRVNQAGQLNAPFGAYKNPNFCDKELILNISKYFNKNKIHFSNDDFGKMLSKIKMGDFVYLDPPYDPISDSSSFTGYNSNGFNKSDQIRLKIFCDKLTKKGAYFLLSNSSTDFIKNLYKNYYLDEIDANRFINCKGELRTKIKEVLIKNYE